MIKKWFIGVVRPQQGLSLVELLVALTVLSLISAAGVKIFQATQESFFDGRVTLAATQRNEAIAAFIYGDFVNKALPASDTPRLYINGSMPADLQAAEKLEVATIFGTASRFQFAAPKCALSSNGDPDIGRVQFPADCVMLGQAKIAERINQVISRGVKIIFAIDGTSTRCSLSRPLENSGIGQIATGIVDDFSCLRMANDPQNVPVQGSHIMLPRFVIYNSVSPASFHTSFIENTSESLTGLVIQAPDRIKMRGDEENALTSIDMITRDPNATVGVVLSLDDPFGILRIGSQSPVPSTVDVSNNGTSTVSLNGPIGAIRAALASMSYTPPNSFFSEETLTIVAQTGPIRRSGVTILDVEANCANETGMATRFDLGQYDPDTGIFTTNQYVTTVLLQTTKYPQTFSGFCKNGIRYDREDGLVTRTKGDNGKNVKLCQEPDQPDDPNHPYWPYVQNSPAIPFARPESITVILLEQTNNNTENRYSLVFIFDDANTPGVNKTARVQFENLEPGRDLTDTTDVYTFADDDDEYQSGVVSANGSVTANPTWGRAHDGFVVPLKLPAGAVDSDGIFDLRFYDQRPASSPNRTGDPNLHSLSTNALTKWNVRARISDESGDRVEFVEIPFGLGSSAPNSAIQIKVQESKRCKPAIAPQEVPSDESPASDQDGNSEGSGEGPGEG
jgi:prepilin-type N-terminal cleavage/methylation domain-containing protein